jgi:hypothetical protein
MVKHNVRGILGFSITHCRGLPFWLHNVQGIVFRTDNEPFKYHMKRYAKMIVKLMKSENLYASQGGPIILSQIENEYGMVGRAFRQEGKSYVKWTAKLAVELDTGVPWVMCKQDDAPDPLVNACNGRQCGETFKGPNSPNKPAIWTENWTSFYQTYGEEPLIRSAEDIAFHVALFIAKNGSFVNYYMYHGGTNFGRNASQFVITSYYDQAPLDEYGNISNHSQSKSDVHLKVQHKWLVLQGYLGNQNGDTLRNYMLQLSCVKSLYFQDCKLQYHWGSYKLLLCLGRRRTYALPFW